MNCQHHNRVGDNYGESCMDCEEILSGFGYGGWFGHRLHPNMECKHLYSPIGEGGAMICIYCEKLHQEKWTAEEILRREG